MSKSPKDYGWFADEAGCLRDINELVSRATGWTGREKSFPAECDQRHLSGTLDLDAVVLVKAVAACPLGKGTEKRPRVTRVLFQDVHPK